MILWISATLGLIVATTILVLIRRDKLHVRHGVFWVLVALVFAGLGFAPPMVDWLAKTVGIGYPPILALVAAIAVLVIKILLMDIDQAHQEVQLQRLIQRVAMLEGSLRQKAKRNDDASAS
ncbi:DUF2304 domain-containing protein [Gilvimarinus sp. DA14]|uniref:DUF2304 domain-containing protein n=1 Tax=Gilvimarinus sp. DA14 TaxID=2956798 RepID=UPI0020B7610D|nr:DUF2304 domain-containing protein [Gilvimarinus sp. DA14]UTF59571.1 DUF2304 domain-containing protein [Gilvimarinus sp. DA14]